MNALLCSYCKKERAIFVCGNRCGKATYCSKVCGQQDYTFHKIECSFHMNHHWDIIVNNTEPKKKLFETPNMGAYAVFIRAGKGLPTEVHPDATQFFLVVQGKGSCSIAGNRDAIQENSMFYVPPGTAHSINADAKEDLKLLTIYSPSEHHTH